MHLEMPSEESTGIGSDQLAYGKVDPVYHDERYFRCRLRLMVLPGNGAFTVMSFPRGP